MAIMMTDSANYTAIANAIREKNGSNTAYHPNEMASAIEEIPTGGGASADPVAYFHDIAGNVISMMFVYQFRGGEQLPDVPEIEGYTSAGWNASPDEPYLGGDLYIYPQYSANDGTPTKIYITIDDESLKYVRLSLGCDTSGKKVNVDWGDGTVEERTANLSSQRELKAWHEYPSVGDYVISITVITGEWYIGGTSYGWNGGVIGDGYVASITDMTSWSNGYTNYYQMHVLKKIHIGKGFVGINDSGLRVATSIDYVLIPCNVNFMIRSNAFVNSCIKCLAIPNVNVVTLGETAFNEMYGMESIRIPSNCEFSSTNQFYGSNIKNLNFLASFIPYMCFSRCSRLERIYFVGASVDNSAFNTCGSLSTVMLKVNSVGNYAFYSCGSLNDVSVEDNGGTLSVGAYSFHQSNFRKLKIKGANAVSLATYTETCVIPHDLYVEGHPLTMADAVFYGAFPKSLVIKGTTVYPYCMFNSQNHYFNGTINVEDGVTEISYAAFGWGGEASWNNISRVVFPSTLTSIGEFAFYTSYTRQVCKTYDFRAATSIPSIASNSLPPTSVIEASCAHIIVPDALYDSWIAASVWSGYAAYIVKASEYND